MKVICPMRNFDWHGCRECRHATAHRCYPKYERLVGAQPCIEQHFCNPMPLLDVWCACKEIRNGVPARRS